MCKPYSEDLRKRVVAAVETGGLSCNAAAKQFGVAISTAIGWVRLQRQTGSVAPGKMGGHRPKAISGEHQVWVLERIKRDFTLRGLVAELAERGLKVDYRSVWEFVHAQKLSFKKKRGGWRARSSGRRQTASSVAQISRSRRSRASCLHRRDLDQNRYGGITRMGTPRPEAFRQSSTRPLETHYLLGGLAP